jgi:hypothetical protein
MPNITIAENAEGGYNVLYNEEALPIHQSDGPFETVEQAKESVKGCFSCPINRQIPNEAESDGGVVAIAEVRGVTLR